MRRRLRVARAGAILWLIAAAWGICDSPAGAESPAPPIAPHEIDALWDSQRTEIATARIRFACFNGEVSNPDNTPERVAELLAEHDLVEHPERLGEFLLALSGRPFEADPPWDEMTLTVSGSRRRLDGRQSRFVTDGTLEWVETPANRQLSIFDVGQSRVYHYGLTDLRWVPPPAVSAAGWQFMRQEADASVFLVPPGPNGTPFKLITSIDSATGIVVHSMTRYPDDKPALERYQSGLRVYPGDITFPQLSLLLTYAGGPLRRAQLFLIHEAEFNLAVPESAFDLPVAEGTRVVDFRGAEKVVYVAEEQTSDVQDLLEQMSRRAPPPAAITPPAKGRHWLPLLAVNLAAAAIAALAWRRRMHRS